MSDLVDRPASEPQESTPAPAPAAAPEAAHWFLAALLAGAGAIHLAMAPSHLGESAVEGAGFVAAGWAQIGLAALVVVRPRRWVLGAAIGTSLALIAAWAVSRTAGLPFGSHSGHAETVSIVDGAAVALEAIAVLTAGALLTRPTSSAVRHGGAALAGALGAFVLATAAIASPAARDHASGSHGEHAGAEHAAADAGEHDHDEMVAAGESAAGESAASDDHPDGHAAHGEEVAATADDLGFAALSNGHQHEQGNDEPLTVEETTLLAGQLAATATLVQQYPTLADAQAAGWTQAGPFSPGLGVHFGGPSYNLNADGDMDPEDLLAPMLIFDGIEPDSRLAGFMFLAYGTSGEPEGFAGPNDHWHYHESVCIVSNPDGSIDTPFGADLEGVTEQMCTEAGGSFLSVTGYMVHVWNVPGYESPDGVFHELNSRITCPDGTYDRIPIEELGDKDTVCPV